MSNYIDGFAFPLPRDRVDNYKQMAQSVADIWLEHGALAYHEYAGDDMVLEGTRPFTDTLATSEDEIVVFGWVVFESREARDLANERVAADPRVANLMGEADSGFDPSRMLYGGFKSFVKSGG